MKMVPYRNDTLKKWNHIEYKMTKYRNRPVQKQYHKEMVLCKKGTIKWDHVEMVLMVAYRNDIII